jgi:hypothetical protein
MAGVVNFWATCYVSGELAGHKLWLEVSRWECLRGKKD